MNAIATNPVGQSLVTQGHGLSYENMEKLAADLAKSGLFGLKTKEQAMALMMISVAEGRHPALAARDYDIIQNRPAKKAEAMMRDFLEGGGKVQWHTLDDALADATFSHPSGGTVRINWNMERAAKAGLKAKENYTKYPRQMLRSRTVSEGVRTVYPIATSGMYVPEEVADFTGPTLEGSAEPQPEAPAPKSRRKAEAAPPAAADPEPPAPETWLDKYTAALTAERSLGQFVTTFADACATASSEGDLVRLMDVDIIKRAFARGAPEVKDQLTKASSNAFARLQSPNPTAQPALDLGAEPWNTETGEITAADRLQSG